MKDEHDKRTIDLVQSAQGMRAMSGTDMPQPAPTLKAKKQPLIRSLVVDEKTEFADPPKCADRKPAAAFGAYANFVPVSFVAKDWKVSSRRIRALLRAGRLLGQLQPNGYWDVRYPYIFTMGTRGPALKRNQKPDKRLKLVVDNSEPRPE